MFEQPALLTVAQVAKLMSVSQSTIHKLADENALPFETVKIGSIKRFRLTDVEQFLGGVGYMSAPSKPSVPATHCEGQLQIPVGLPGGPAVVTCEAGV